MINNFFVTTELFIRNKDDIYMKIGCLFSIFLVRIRFFLH